LFRFFATGYLFWWNKDMVKRALRKSAVQPMLNISCRIISCRTVHKQTTGLVYAWCNNDIAWANCLRSCWSFSSCAKSRRAAVSVCKVDGRAGLCLPVNVSCQQRTPAAEAATMADNVLFTSEIAQSRTAAGVLVAFVVYRQASNDRRSVHRSVHHRTVKHVNTDGMPTAQQLVSKFHLRYTYNATFVDYSRPLLFAFETSESVATSHNKSAKQWKTKWILFPFPFPFDFCISQLTKLHFRSHLQHTTFHL